MKTIKWFIICSMFAVYVGLFVLLVFLLDYQLTEYLKTIAVLLLVFAILGIAPIVIFAQTFNDWFDSKLK